MEKGTATTEAGIFVGILPLAHVQACPTQALMSGDKINSSSILHIL